MRTDDEYQAAAYAELQAMIEPEATGGYGGAVQALRDRFGTREIVELAFNLTGALFIDKLTELERDDAADEVIAAAPDLRGLELIKAIRQRIDARRTTAATA